MPRVSSGRAYGSNLQTQSPSRRGEPVSMELPADGGPKLPQRTRSPIIGDLRLDVPERPPSAGGPVEGADVDAAVSIILELNLHHPGRLHAVTARFRELWRTFQEGLEGGQRPPRSVRITAKLYQCVLSRRLLAQLVDLDRADRSRPPVIFRAWPDYTMFAHVD